MVTIKGQRQVQIGDEVSWGTAVAPTVELSGIDPDSFNVPPSVVSEIVRAARGGIVPGRDTVDIRHEVDGASIGGWVIYEQIAYFLDMLDEVTPAGAGPYTYTYDAPTTTQAVPHPQTLVMANGDAVYSIAGACARSITFDWEWGQQLMFSVDLMGADVESDALAALDETAAASLTYALASECTFYLDALGGTLGNTPIDKVPKGSITINPQRHYQRRVGSLYPAGVYDSPYWDITGTVTLEMDATTAGYVDAIVAGATTKLLQIKFNNGEAGADERGLQFSMASIIRVDNVFTDDDDMTTMDLSFEPIEEGDWTTPAAGEIDGYFEMISTSSTATLY